MRQLLESPVIDNWLAEWRSLLQSLPSAHGDGRISDGQMPGAKRGSDIAVEDISDRFRDLDRASLLRIRVSLEAEMARRGEAFSVGDIGEAMAVAHFRETANLPPLQTAPTGTRNVDCLSRDGDRYSIKTLWKARKTSAIYPDPDDSNRPLFEYLLLIHLGPELDLESIVRFSWAQFVSARKWDKRMFAWYINDSQRSLAKGEQLFAASSQVDGAVSH